MRTGRNAWMAVLAVVAALQTYTAAGQENARKESMKVEIESHTHINITSGIVYSQITGYGENRLLRMTVMAPSTQEPKPAVVFFPGGGFMSAGHEKFLELRMALAKAGFVVAAAEYRTVPDRFPALIVDAKAAVRYLRAHAALFGIDPARIGVIGDSAGGYVAQMTGATNGEKQFDRGDYLEVASDVQAVATLYGISDLTNIGEGYSEKIREIHASPAVTEALLLHGPAFHEYPGASILSDPEKALDASPMGHIKAQMPPYLVMHGSADRLVSPVQSEQLYEALREKGNRVDYVVVENAGHGDEYWFQQAVTDKIVGWFKEVLY